MNYEIQFSKVTCSGKLADRFLSSQHSKSQDLTRSSMGETFSLVEILSPWYNSAQIGQMIINNFSNAYFEGGSTSDLQNFELALKKINENLAQITQNGETEWIGNLSGILATIVGKSLILSATGKTEAYLFRDGKINHLTYGMTDKVEVHPLKTFSNVISGSLKAKDKILITNKNLFDHVPLESLRQIITLNDPPEAASEIAKLLRKTKVKNVNFFIVNLLSKEALAEKPLKDNLENVFYLDKSSESALTKIKAFWQTVLSPLGKITKTQGIKIFNFIQSITKHIGKNKQSRKTKVSSYEKPEIHPDLNQPESDKFQKEFMLKDSRDDHLLKDEEIKYSPELYVHYYQEKKTAQQNKTGGVIKNIFQSTFIFLKKSFLWFLGLYTHKDKRKFFYIIVAAIFIIIIGLVIGFKGKGQSGISNLDSQKILDEAIATQKDAKNALSLGDNEKAKQKFMDAINKAEEIKTNSLVSKDAEAVISTSYQELDKLTSTTRYNNLEPAITMTDDIKGLYIASGQAYLTTDVDVYKASILGGKPQKVATLPKNKGNFITGTNFGTILYFYTSNQNVFEFDTSSDKLSQTQISEDGRWETANAISGYVGSLYLLDGVLGQIYKHSSSKEIFQKGEEYISSSNNLKQSLSLAIDGSLYVLKDDGKVLKFQRSKLQDFSLKNIPTPWDKITEPRKIYTDSDTPSLYILDTAQKRILEFDKEGVFIKQYALPQNFDKISDFYVSIKSKKIWVLNDKSVYEITI